MIEDLRRKQGQADGAGVDPREKRQPVDVNLYLTAAERKQLEAQAKAERRSLSGYVARVIAKELHQ